MNIEESSKDAVRRIIDEYAAQRGGQITPDEVVTLAEPEESLLHKYFEWDDSIAAVKYRLEQAQSMIRWVKVVTVVEGVTMVTPHFVRNPACGPNERGSISVFVLRNDKEMSQQAVVREFGLAIGALERAHNLCEVLGVKEKIDRIKKAVQRAKHEMELAAAN